MVNNPKLNQFLNTEYMRLETFKRSGLAVATPVWFVDDGQVIYVRSYASSGKAKRMRNNPRVRVAPSDPLGNPKGVTIEGTARLVDSMKSVQVSQLLYRKYGLMKMSFDIWGAIKQLDWAVFEIEV